eukprot:m.137653 g.137653  ORF g.137653 m.137653 type:complete len:221 (+) comp15898_c0_seq1:125-787(+)
MESPTMTMEDMNREANDLVDQDLEATRRMRNLVTEDVETNTKTLAELERQGHQLVRIENNLDGINENTKQAEKELTKMEKCCGLCFCPCTKRHNFEGDSANYNKVWHSKSQSDAHRGSDGVITQQPSASARGGNRRGNASSQSEGKYIEPILQDDARESEMNDNMRVVSSSVAILKQQAMAMNEELDTQNDVIDRITAKTDSDTARVAKASERTVALLHK